MLRPLLAGKYIQERQCPPPVLFDDLMKLDMPNELRNGIENLLEIKKKSDEREKGIQIPVIRDFITDELVSQKAYVDGIVDDRRCGWKELNDVFQKVLG